MKHIQVLFFSRTNTQTCTEVRLKKLHGAGYSWAPGVCVTGREISRATQTYIWGANRRSDIHSVQWVRGDDRIKMQKYMITQLQHSGECWQCSFQSLIGVQLIWPIFGTGGMWHVYCLQRVTRQVILQKNRNSSVGQGGLLYCLPRNLRTDDWPEQHRNPQPS